jgi:hypothetical protein
MLRDGMDPRLAETCVHSKSCAYACKEQRKTDRRPSPLQELRDNSLMIIIIEP